MTLAIVLCFLYYRSVSLQPNYHFYKNVDSQDISWSIHILENIKTIRGYKRGKTELVLNI